MTALTVAHREEVIRQGFDLLAIPDYSQKAHQEVVRTLLDHIDGEPARIAEAVRVERGDIAITLNLAASRVRAKLGRGLDRDSATAGVAAILDNHATAIRARTGRSDIISRTQTAASEQSDGGGA